MKIAETEHHKIYTVVRRYEKISWTEVKTIISKAKKKKFRQGLSSLSIQHEELENNLHTVEIEYVIIT